MVVGHGGLEGARKGVESRVGVGKKWPIETIKEERPVEGPWLAVGAGGVGTLLRGPNPHWSSGRAPGPRSGG